jgi:class 3 adenylate cyclase/tetratricopeptide (TPR) repeat protein
MSNAGTSEIRYVAVLFSDISGFTALSESLDPEEVTTKMEACYRIMGEAVLGHGGWIDSFQGDAVLAYFGVKEPGENPSLDALRAAIQIREGLDDLNATEGSNLGISQGIATALIDINRVALSDIASIRAALDSVIKSAKHYESDAERGQILCDPMSRDSTAKEFRFDGDELMQVLIAAPPRRSTLYDKIAFNLRSIADQERRKVSILFADLVDFKRATSGLTDAAREGLRRDIFHAWERTVEQFEGTLDKFMGDGALVVFGAPVAHEDDAFRAVKTALDFRRQAEEIANVRGYEVETSCGVNTGLVVAGAIGTEGKTDLTALGDTVNTASRFKDHAAGALYITSSTFREIRDRFHIDPRPDLSVKGKKEPQKCYAVSAERTQRVEARLRPMVGRKVELAKITRVLDGLKEGRGAFLSITGEAGVGKTRLAQQFVQFLRERRLPYYVGRGQSYGKNMASLPIRSLMRDYFGIEDNDTGDAARAKIEERVRGLLAKFVEQRSEALAWFVGYPYKDAALDRLEPKARAQMVEASIIEILQTTAEKEGPLVLVMEDTHWYDPISLGLIEQFSRSFEDFPILVQLLYRPEFEDPFASQLGDRYTLIHLQPFQPDETREMIAGLLETEHPPESLIDPIKEKSKGNPFYIGEIVRKLREDEKLKPVPARVPGGGSRTTIRWELAPGDIEVPDTLTGVIMSRVDKLARPVKEQLQVASVVGRVFSPQVLEFIAPDPSGVAAAIAELDKREFVEKFIAEGSVVEFRFTHELLRETAYNSLLKKTRKHLHQQIGEAMERIYHDAIERQYDLLVSHFRESGDQERLIKYLVLAADRNRTEFNNEVAINYYSEVLELLAGDGTSEPDARIPEVRYRFSQVAYQIGKYAEAKEQLGKLLIETSGGTSGGATGAKA